jgi:hypothetical protein
MASEKMSSRSAGSLKSSASSVSPERRHPDGEPQPRRVREAAERALEPEVEAHVAWETGIRAASMQMALWTGRGTSLE